MLTFDDGYRDNYTHAFVLACQWRIPISIYLVPGYIESGAHFWWLEREHLAQLAQVYVAHVEGRTYHFDIPVGQRQHIGSEVLQAAQQAWLSLGCDHQLWPEHAT